MEDATKIAFYYGAIYFLNLDSDEIDDALSKVGLDTNQNSVQECRRAIIQAFPDRWAKAKSIGRQLKNEF